MSEQKMDAERAAFEAWFGDYSLPVRMNGGMMNDAQMFDAWKARADQSAIAPESWWHLIHDTLKNYCMHTLSDGEGGGYPLIDAMTADGQSVSGGIEECTYLADAIWNALASSAPAAPTVKAELTACNCPGGSKPDQSSHAPNCPVRNGEPSPSLPAAGSAVEMLLPALRQYRHNSGGDDLIPGYDYEETNRIVAALSTQQSGAVSVPRGTIKQWVTDIQCGVISQRAVLEQLRALLSNTAQQKEG